MSVCERGVYMIVSCIHCKYMIINVYVFNIT